jgi:phosphate starvation-inducible PhoH-like protein
MTMDLTEKKITLGTTDTLSLFGYNDSNLLLLENRFGTTITVRGDAIILRGAPAEVKLIEKIIQEMQYILQRTGTLTTNDVQTIIDLVSPGAPATASDPVAENDSHIYVTHNETIRARTPHQREYVDKVRKNDIVFAVGPAGTGKTFLAVAMALAALRNREVNRIVLSRPAVEAGESLGFLPGDLNEKVDPYLRPLLDALTEMVSAEKLKSMSEKRIVEIIPLAYMRGRTFNNSFIILDEAQNTTATQMKMFLTRLGRNSKAIVTGDDTQIDLPHPLASGLIDVQHILKNIPGIGFMYFDKYDVVRHRLVTDIINAYALAAERKEQNSKERRSISGSAKAKPEVTSGPTEEPSTGNEETA